MFTEVKNNGLTQFRLLLINNDSVSYSSVYSALISILKCSPAEAQIITRKAQENGSHILCETHKERIEILAEQFGYKSVPVIYSKLLQETD